VNFELRNNLADKRKGSAYEEVEDRMAEQSKALKEVKEEQREIIHFWKRKSDDLEKRTERAEKERDAMRKDLKAWQKAYHALFERAERAEYEGDRDYHLRILAEIKAREEKDTMANKVMELRSGIEEHRISEADLLSEYKQLCFKVTECMSMLKFYIPEDRQRQMEDLRPLLGFEAPAALEMGFIDNALANLLIQKVLETVEIDYIHSIAQWSTADHNMEENANVSALMEMEKAIFEKVEELRSRKDEEEDQSNLTMKMQRARAAARGKSCLPDNSDTILLIISQLKAFKLFNNTTVGVRTPPDCMRC
jgi:hypothetical protein